MSKSFTEKQINAISCLYTKNRMSTTAIGEKYGVTCNTIIKILKDNGIHVARGLLQTVLFTDNEKKDIIDRYNNRETTVQIAKSYGCSYATIRKLLKENEVFCGGRVHNKIIFAEDAYNAILQAYNDGESANSLSKQYNCSDSVILALLRQNGIDTNDYGRGNRKKSFLNRGHTRTCRSLSRRVYNDHVRKINPKRNPISRYEYHLDHKLPIALGYELGLTILDLAHPCNLRVVRASTNLSKGIKSCIDRQKLINAIKNWNRQHGDPFQNIDMEVVYRYHYGRYQYLKGEYRYYGEYKS